MVLAFSKTIYLPVRETGTLIALVISQNLLITKESDCLVSQAFVCKQLCRFGQKHNFIQCYLFVIAIIWITCAKVGSVLIGRL